MATITRQEAVTRLTRAVEEAEGADLVEFHNELFPADPLSEDDADLDAVLAKVVRHIKNGLEIEEIIDLWNVVFPGHRNVWFDEEEGLIHYDETSEPIAVPM